ncbi:hypothetical protein BKA82DRAFT_920807 [Pisolithus tinctorius]|uniref:BTB domain-containing protein n=1 Tax=Pisolithus tinctorius Marx 270 TaxID=870435 RepID=A0A0C3NN62_PISTI|nr:hypothetical protein BKA82DRAFT_920807 [Pisolithus tinctorius]KIN97070.1 hypothetical protein M404DRAFT_920807 [Pisolithus tinctorius Marx 270]
MRGVASLAGAIPTNTAMRMVSFSIKAGSQQMKVRRQGFLPLPSMSDSQDLTPYASPPFDHEKADVILRSSDNVDFRVFKLFLSLASPFFETLFDLPQPSEEMSTDVEIKDGLPVVPVSEDSKTLDPLLRFCYPCTLADDPALEDFRGVINVLEAAKKYSLDAIERTVCKSLFNPKILETNSLRCFSIACRARLQDECILAAKYTLGEPLIPMWFEEIELITSTELLALLTYHRKCGAAVQALKSDFSWFTTEYTQSSAPWMVALRPNGYSYSGCCQRSTSGRYPMLYGSGVAQWWEAFMDATFLDLQDKPCAETILRNVEKAIQAVRQHNCVHCSASAPGGMREFGTLFIRKVEELISGVDLELRF